MNITRPIVMEIDLKNFHHNMKSIREKIGENITIMPVIKANAYGTYINHRLDILNEFHLHFSVILIIEHHYSAAVRNLLIY